MKLQINGEPRDFDPPLTLTGLVNQLAMKADRVAIELNRSIVARDQWTKTHLAEGDRLEIVHFVGGGWDPEGDLIPSSSFNDSLTT